MSNEHWVGNNLQVDSQTSTKEANQLVDSQNKKNVTGDRVDQPNARKSPLNGRDSTEAATIMQQSGHFTLGEKHTEKAPPKKIPDNNFKPVPTGEIKSSIASTKESSSKAKAVVKACGISGKIKKRTQPKTKPAEEVAKFNSTYFGRYVSLAELNGSSLNTKSTPGDKTSVSSTGDSEMTRSLDGSATECDKSKQSSEVKKYDSKFFSRFISKADVAPSSFTTSLQAVETKDGKQVKKKTSATVKAFMEIFGIRKSLSKSNLRLCSLPESTDNAAPSSGSPTKSKDPGNVKSELAQQPNPKVAQIGASNSAVSENELNRLPASKVTFASDSKEEDSRNAMQNNGCGRGDKPNQPPPPERNLQNTSFISPYIFKTTDEQSTFTRHPATEANDGKQLKKKPSSAMKIFMNTLGYNKSKPKSILRLYSLPDKSKNKSASSTGSPNMSINKAPSDAKSELVQQSNSKVAQSGVGIDVGKRAFSATELKEPSTSEGGLENDSKTDELMMAKRSNCERGDKPKLPLKQLPQTASDSRVTVSGKQPLQVNNYFIFIQVNHSEVTPPPHVKSPLPVTANSQEKSEKKPFITTMEKEDLVEFKNDSDVGKNSDTSLDTFVNVIDTVVAQHVTGLDLPKINSNVIQQENKRKIKSKSLVKSKGKSVRPKTNSEEKGVKKPSTATMEKKDLVEFKNDSDVEKNSDTSPDTSARGVTVTDEKEISTDHLNSEDIEVAQHDTGLELPKTKSERKILVKLKGKRKSVRQKRKSKSASKILVRSKSTSRKETKPKTPGKNANESKQSAGSARPKRKSKSTKKSLIESPSKAESKSLVKSKSKSVRQKRKSKSASKILVRSKSTSRKETKPKTPGKNANETKQSAGSARPDSQLENAGSSDDSAHSDINGSSDDEDSAYVHTSTDGRPDFCPTPSPWTSKVINDEPDKPVDKKKKDGWQRKKKKREY